MTTKDAARLDGPIVRCVKLIRLLAEIDSDISIKDAASHLDLPASTTHRLLRVLMQEGMVAKDPKTSRYRAGIDLERLGSLLSYKKGFRDLTLPYLERIVAQCGEACMFVAYLPATHQVSVMAAVNSLHPLRYEMELYVPHTVLWGATGRSILAFLPEEEQRAIAAKGDRSPATGAPPPAWEILKAELDAIRDRGYVLTRSQKLSGAVGIGAPVRNGSATVIGSFCITVPEIRFDPGKEKALATSLIEQAAEFSASIGFRSR
ncbi:IclR family transcriptional regulator [Mesorhizobium sp. KR2-14]|uniref:IclR family transcriptional regulator n=1 Tax=Mesorhizobium sp. KR2-14 TaxID=3156610 RepID=UPI0032B49A31